MILRRKTCERQIIALSDSEVDKKGSMSYADIESIKRIIREPASAGSLLTFKKGSKANFTLNKKCFKVNDLAL